MSPAAVARKHQRIIRRAVQFHGRHLARLRQRIAHRAVYLRRAPQTVRILHALIFLRGAVRLANLAALVQVRQIPRRRRRARVRARMHDPRVKRAGASAQRIQRKRSGHIRGVHHNVGFVAAPGSIAPAFPACHSAAKDLLSPPAQRA